MFSFVEFVEKIKFFFTLQTNNDRNKMSSDAKIERFDWLEIYELNKNSIKSAPNKQEQ